MTRSAAVAGFGAAVALLAAGAASGVTVAASTGKPSDKVAICHKGHTITVDDHALPAHLAHGDTIGPCNITKHNHDRDDDDK